MFNVRRGRDILGPNRLLTNPQQETLRDQMVCLAQISLDEACRHAASELGILVSAKPLPQWLSAEPI
jgi:hypothetical protein